MHIFRENTNNSKLKSHVDACVYLKLIFFLTFFFLFYLLLFCVCVCVCVCVEGGLYLVFCYFIVQFYSNSAIYSLSEKKKECTS